MNRSYRTALKGLAVAVTAFGAFAGLNLLATPNAEAQVAAKVESQTRPNFGLLLDPPPRSRSRGHRRWDYRSHRGGYRPDYRGPGYHPPGGPQQEVVLIDCGGNPGSGGIESAVQRVRPGGTLIIRSRGGACVGWLNVDRPLTIIGEGGFDPRSWDHNQAATLQAPDGLPCITVAQGVRVEIRDVVFSSPHGGDASCVVGYGAQILMNRVGFRHAGDEAAIFMDGGQLDLRDVMIDAETISAAVVADGTTVTAHEVDIRKAQSGMELTPGAGDPSRLSRVRMKGLQTPNTFGPRSIGLIVRAARDYGRVLVSQSRICGYTEGVAVEGAVLEITDSRICRSDRGLVLYNGELKLTHSRIRASDIGVGVVSGRAVITDNVFAQVRTPIDGDRRYVEDRNNRTWSRRDICRPRYEDRYRGRYQPDMRSGSRNDCQYESYPREWWGEEEGWYGDMPYIDDAYRPQQYDQFEDGRGWYDRDGGYIDNDVCVGDARWRNRSCGAASAERRYPPQNDEQAY